MWGILGRCGKFKVALRWPQEIIGSRILVHDRSDLNGSGLRKRKVLKQALAEIFILGSWPTHGRDHFREIDYAPERLALIMGQERRTIAGAVFRAHCIKK